MPTQLAAEATLLVPTEGSLGWIYGRIVDRDVAGLEFARHRVGSLDVIRPDRGSEAIDGAVRHPDDIILGFEWDHRQDRPEDLLLSQAHVGSDISENGRFDEVASGECLGGDPPATREQFGTILLRYFAVVEDAVALLAEK